MNHLENHAVDRPKEPPVKAPSNYRALRFYQEVLDLERLHYGMWLRDDALTFDNLKQAQKRYENFIINHIPSEVRSVIDVGCGTGVLLSRLKELDYQAEGLTPDINQQQVLSAKGLQPIHACRFEDFHPEKPYDCIIMSESAQYIPLEKLFHRAAETLQDQGYLMVCDYFILNHARGIMAKSGHNLDRFLAAAQASRFALLQQQDVTGDVLKTLVLAKHLADKALLAADIGTEKIRKRYPLLTRLVLRLFRTKIRRAEENMQLIDAEKFQQNKTYQFFLFQSGSSGNHP